MKRLSEFLFVALTAILCCSCSQGVRVRYVSEESRIQDFSNLKLQVFMESSGSMNGYLCAGSQLKDAVYGYVGALAAIVDTVELNYINSKVIPYGDDLKFFVRDLTSQHLRSVSGNTGHSDIASMFEAILNRTDENTVSIFVSDCILDVPEGEASNYYVNRSLDIKNAFQSKIRKEKDLSVIVLRLESVFDGWYFYAKGKEYLKKEKRPYFMFVIGGKDALAYLNRNVSIQEIPHGVANYFALTSGGIVPFQITNRSGVSMGNTCECRPDRDGFYRILLKADLSSALQETGALCQLDRYRLRYRTTVLEEVVPLQDEASGYTHLMQIAISPNAKSCAERLALHAEMLPVWLDAVHDDSGKDIRSHLDETTGIKYIIEGVAGAYDGVDVLATMDFVVENH